jgi:hypothetical protein
MSVTKDKEYIEDYIMKAELSDIRFILDILRKKTMKSKKEGNYFFVTLSGDESMGIKIEYEGYDGMCRLLGSLQLIIADLTVSFNKNMDDYDKRISEC